MRIWEGQKGDDGSGSNGAKEAVKNKLVCIWFILVIRCVLFERVNINALIVKRTALK
jgi:hypothetical protein